MLPINASLYSSAIFPTTYCTLALVIWNCKRLLNNFKKEWKNEFSLLKSNCNGKLLCWHNMAIIQFFFTKFHIVKKIENKQSFLLSIPPHNPYSSLGNKNNSFGTCNLKEWGISIINWFMHRKWISMPMQIKMIFCESIFLCLIFYPIISYLCYPFMILYL